MGLARHASLPTVVVGDIDRGGVFAAMFGTVALLEPSDQRLVSGFVVNKFRGDPALLSPGLESLQRLTGRRVHGVLPWDPTLWLDSEDTLDLESRRSTGSRAFRVAVVRLPRISNFTDADGVEGPAGTDVEGLGLHGSLEGDSFRGALLAELLGRDPSTVSFRAAREASLNRLGDLVDDGAPVGLPVLPLGGSEVSP
jgi:cobyric acid synthase